MAETNVNASSITPEVPKVLENEQITVYVPNATSDTPGVASFDDNHFDVGVDGKVVIEPRIISDLEYSRRTIDDAEDNAALILDGEIYKNSLLQTTSKTLIPAINELKGRIDTHDITIGTGELLVPEEVAAGESGLIGLANANYRKLSDYIQHAGVIHSDFNNRINANVKTLEEHKTQLDDHESRVKIAESEIDTLQAEVGSDVLTTSAQNLKGAVNETVDIARKARDQAQTNKVNLISIDAQLQGVAKSFAIDTFLEFIDFINRRGHIPLYEDRDGDGTDELYEIYVDDLKTGDNILVVEDKVPDFWFEKTADVSGADTYPYEETEYSLAAYGQGDVPIGVMHILETDYTVIAAHALSAADAATRAKESEEQTKSYYDETKALAESIYVKQVGPPLSALQTAIVLPSATLAMIGG